MIEIIERLRVWREIRGINPSTNGLRNNLIDEFAEILEDIENEEYVIAEVCDIAIWTLNSFTQEENRNYFLFEELPVNAEFPAELSDLLRCLKSIEKFETRAKLVDNCQSYLCQKGYDFKTCMLEKIKQIESRTGRWSEEEKKWIKTSQGEYIADMSKGKIWK